MTIDRRFDFPSFLARRRETLTEWLGRTGVHSYEQLLVQLESLGALPLERHLYDASRPQKSPHVLAPPARVVENIDEIAVGSTDVPRSHDVLKRQRKARKLLEGAPPTDSED